MNDIPRNITVLKVPHHGAAKGLNQEIIEHLNPQVSILSVGENFFGHPSNYTLHLLSRTKLLRTDVHNAILLKFNKKKMKIYNFDVNKKGFKRI